MCKGEEYLRTKGEKIGKRRKKIEMYWIDQEYKEKYLQGRTTHKREPITNDYEAHQTATRITVTGIEERRHDKGPTHCHLTFH